MGRELTRIERQFNRSAAGSYDKHARVQRTMADRMFSFLAGRISEDRLSRACLLEIGCGTGILTELLVNHWPRTAITALDIAPAMIKEAERRVRSTIANHNSEQHRIRFLHADVEMWAADAPAASFDLIVSNACFQWLRNPRQTLVLLQRLLRPDGLLVFMTFGPETFRELHQSFEEVYRAYGMEPQRHGMSFRSTAQWGKFLQAAGFAKIYRDCSIQTETYRSAKDFLLSVKALGASASEATATPGFGLRHLFSDMYKMYENKFSIPGGVTATYDLLFLYAVASLSDKG